jgi:putative flippase GtrA
LGKWQLILRYAVFAAMATVANLAAQRLVLKTVTADLRLALAIGVGTIVGLILKYILDKRWIFFDTTSGTATHAKKFTLYTVMGISTTLIFWGAETAFWMIWKTDAMREVGAILGLIVGYVVKYNLDRRYVFQDSSGH